MIRTEIQSSIPRSSNELARSRGGIAEARGRHSHKEGEEHFHLFLQLVFNSGSITSIILIAMDISEKLRSTADALRGCNGESHACNRTVTGIVTHHGCLSSTRSNPEESSIKRDDRMYRPGSPNSEQ